MFLQIVFVTAPAILGAGYLVYRGRSYLAEAYSIEVSDLWYNLAVFVCMYVAMYVTIPRSLKSILKTAEEGTRNDT